MCVFVCLFFINWTVLVTFYVDYIIQLKEVIIQEKIDHFTVLCSVTWPLNGSKARGELVLM